MLVCSFVNLNILGFVLRAKAIQSILNALEENGCENLSLSGHTPFGAF